MRASPATVISIRQRVCQVNPLGLLAELAPHNPQRSAHRQVVPNGQALNRVVKVQREGAIGQHVRRSRRVHIAAVCLERLCAQHSAILLQWPTCNWYITCNGVTAARRRSHKRVTAVTASRGTSDVSHPQGMPQNCLFQSPVYISPCCREVKWEACSKHNSMTAGHGRPHLGASAKGDVPAACRVGQPVLGVACLHLRGQRTGAHLQSRRGCL